jgi:hypothetical protein
VLHLRAQKLKERETLLEKDAGDTRRPAELSQQIRADIRLIKEKIEALSVLQKKEAKRARVRRGVACTCVRASLVLIALTARGHDCAENAERGAGSGAAARRDCAAVLQARGGAGGVGEAAARPGAR